MTLPVSMICGGAAGFGCGLQIAARLRVGAKQIIKHAELVARGAKLGVIESELLVGADRRFNIPVRGGRAAY
jgi:hypothetical protein